MALPGIFQGRWDAWTFYQLATLCRMNYRPDGDLWARWRQAMATHVNRLALEPGVVNGSPRSMLLVYGEHQVVIINGSSVPADWVMNALAMITATVPDRPTHQVGSGWWTDAGNIYPALKTLGWDPAKATIWAGHSLGAAIALCCAYQHNDEPNKGESIVVTFGSPLVGNAAFLGGVHGQHYRVVNGLDIVTNVPARGWVSGIPGVGAGLQFNNHAHNGHLYWMHWNNGRTSFATNSGESGWEFFRRLSSQDATVPQITVAEAFTQHLTDHLIWSYCQSLRRRLSRVVPFQLYGVDAINDRINADTAAAWADPDILLSGFDSGRNRLIEDPALPLAPAPAENEPLPVGPGVLPVTPGGQPRPPSPAELELRALRRRRNIG